MKIKPPESKYLKADDLKGQEWEMSIANVTHEDIGQEGKREQKYIVYFERAQKGMVLNKTNLSVLVHAYGDESDDWVGRPVLVYDEMVRFQGQMVPGLRLRIPRKTARPSRHPQTDRDENSYVSTKDGGGPAPGARTFERSVDDEIPF